MISGRFKELVLSQSKQAVAELPSGGPTDRGLPLDPGIPGTSTFTKPLNETRTPEVDDESIYRVDDANSISKDRDRIDTKEDNASQSTSFNGLGDSGASSKTKYPYRDGIPNEHNASTLFLKEMWRLNRSHVRTLKASMRPLTIVSESKTSAVVEEVLKGLDRKFEQRSRACKAVLKRADIGNLRWIFSVDCGNGPKAVKIKALTDGRVRAFSKVNVEVSCSCQAWQWLGPEYHSKSESYLLGKQRGTASEPNIRDPERDNRVCKHVAAALAIAKAWTLPKPSAKVLKKAFKVRRALKRAAVKQAALELKVREFLNYGVKGTVLEWEDGPYGVSVRARIRANKFEYQLKKASSEVWPYHWVVIQDPAMWVSRLGLDRKWSSLPLRVREQLMRVS